MRLGPSALLVTTLGFAIVSGACTSEPTLAPEPVDRADVALSPPVPGVGKAAGTIDLAEALPELTPGPTVPTAPSGEHLITLPLPRSVPATPGVWYEYHTDHYGVFSPIDFDGSYWLPIGISEDPRYDAGNARPGRISLVDSGTARFESDGGVTVLLERLHSPVWPWLCQ